jgi:hypothetical protein
LCELIPASNVTIIGEAHMRIPEDNEPSKLRLRIAIGTGIAVEILAVWYWMAAVEVLMAIVPCIFWTPSLYTFYPVATTLVVVGIGTGMNILAGKLAKPLMPKRVHAIVWGLAAGAILYSLLFPSYMYVRQTAEVLRDGAKVTYIVRQPIPFIGIDIPVLKREATKDEEREIDQPVIRIRTVWE